MSISHAASGELIELFDARPPGLGEALRLNTSKTLVRADHLEVFRMALPAGKETPEHRASGAITIQCLEGVVEFVAHGQRQIFQPGSLVYLSDGEPHAVKALEDASLLITVLLRRV